MAWSFGNGVGWRRHQGSGRAARGSIHWDLPLGSVGIWWPVPSIFPPMAAGREGQVHAKAGDSPAGWVAHGGTLREACWGDSKPKQSEPVAMTQQFAVPDDAPPHHPHYGDAFVVFSVTVLSCAVGAWLLLRLGVALWVGSLAALGVYAALLSLHLLVR